MIANTNTDKESVSIGNQPAVVAQIVRDLYGQIPSALIATLVALVMFTYAFRETADQSMLVVWFVAMLLVTVLRGATFFAWKHHSNCLSDVGWLRLYAGAGFAAGCSWAAVFFTVTDFSNLMLIAGPWMLIFGVMSACTGLMWQHIPTFVAFTLPMVIVGGLATVLLGAQELRWLSAALVLYYVAILAFTRNTNRLYLNGIGLTLEKGALVRHLERHTDKQESIISERTAALRREQESLQHLATHDHLTGLPNRSLFVETLGDAIDSVGEEQGMLALLFIDLDNFKQINDSLGHSVGDRVLCAVAQRLGAAVRKTDTLARFGGDEFTVLLPDLENELGADTISEKILEVLAAPLMLNDLSVVVSASIGVSFYPSDCATAEELLRNADAAMYRAKHEGRNTFSRYTAEMTAQALNRVSLESSLREAFDKEQLFLAYQPQIDMRTGALIGAEALLRWEHPEHGLVSPAKFIPIAEESGLIVPIGRWVLERVCETSLALHERGLEGLCFSANVSARQLLDPNFETDVQNILRFFPCAERHLELEITESVLLQNAEAALKVLRGIRDLNIDVAIDDFGTGYSSLSYLKHYPINRLKIDSSFVKDVERDGSDRAIAAAVVALAKSLSLSVIAEGVETSGQREILLEEGCTDGQGYLFAKAMSPEELEEFAKVPPSVRLDETTGYLPKLVTGVL